MHAATLEKPHAGCWACANVRQFETRFPGPIEVWCFVRCTAPAFVQYGWRCTACSFSGTKSRHREAVCEAADEHRCDFPAAPSRDDTLF